MTLFQAVRLVYSQYSQFEGRASRPEWWLWFLFIWIAIVGAPLVAIILDLTITSLFGKTVEVIFDALFVLALLVVWFGSIIPHYAVMFRRLHDTDRSGWSIFILFVPVVGVVLLVYWLAQPGSEGVNRYGAGRVLNTGGAPGSTFV